MGNDFEIWVAGFWAGAYEYGAGGDEISEKEVHDLYMEYMRNRREEEGDFAR